MTKINLGDEVRDIVTGFKGVAVGRTTWLSGCDRITIQPKGVNKDGKVYEACSFDIDTIEVLKAKKVKEGQHKTGGPAVYGNASKY